jgi:hypothetical protein
MEAPRSSETSVLKRVTRHNIPEDGIIHAWDIIEFFTYGRIEMHEKCYNRIVTTFLANAWKNEESNHKIRSEIYSYFRRSWIFIQGHLTLCMLHTTLKYTHCKYSSSVIHTGFQGLLESVACLKQAGYCRDVRCKRVEDEINRYKGPAVFWLHSWWRRYDMIDKPFRCSPFDSVE